MCERAAAIDTGLVEDVGLSLDNVDAPANRTTQDDENNNSSKNAISRRVQQQTSITGWLDLEQAEET
jgi:hypothetical protein